MPRRAGERELRGLRAGDESVLVDETDGMRVKQQETVQAGLRANFAAVQEKTLNHSDEYKPSAGEGSEMTQQQDRLLTQAFDGIDISLNPAWIDNPEARMDLENVLREQHQKKLQAQQDLDYHTTPTPKLF